MKEEHDLEAQSPSLTEALVEASPDALIALSPSGEVLFWNNGARTLFGYSREEALGRNLEDLVIPADGRAEARQAMQDALGGRTVLFETVRCRKDGSHIDVDVSQRAVKDA